MARPIDNRGRLIFAMDATASREATWDKASQLQGDMFVKTRGIGDLDIQLLYYRGYAECRASKWVNNAKSLLRLMQSVHCLAGATQIGRVLRHALGESQATSIQAMVFVGDCAEEDPETLYQLSGKLKIIGLPMFIFQEGDNPIAKEVFSNMAKLSGGAHCTFNHQSARQLGDLLNAVATYAAGGRAALKALASEQKSFANRLLRQLS